MKKETFLEGKVLFGQENKEREIKKQIHKIKKVIELGGDKLSGEVDFRIEKATGELKKMGLEIKQDELLVKALKLLREDWGGLPENLAKKFTELKEKDIAQKIFQEWVSEDKNELYSLLRKYVVASKKEGLELDGAKIEKYVYDLSEQVDEQK